MCELVPPAYVPDACACPPVYTCRYMYHVRDGGVIPPARLVFHGEIMPEMAYYRDAKCTEKGSAATEFALGEVRNYLEVGIKKTVCAVSTLLRIQVAHTVFVKVSTLVAGCR